MIVAQRLGGRDIWLSLSAPDSSRLAPIIGTAQAQRVAELLGPPAADKNGDLGVGVLFPGNRRCLSEDQVRSALARNDEAAAERLGVNETSIPAWRERYDNRFGSRSETAWSH